MKELIALEDMIALAPLICAGGAVAGIGLAALLLKLLGVRRRISRRKAGWHR